MAKTYEQSAAQSRVILRRLGWLAVAAVVVVIGLSVLQRKETPADRAASACLTAYDRGNEFVGGQASASDTVAALQEPLAHAVSAANADERYRVVAEDIASLSVEIESGRSPEHLAMLDATCGAVRSAP